MREAHDRWWRLGVLLTLGSVWFVASFFLLGDLGLWNDDWFFNPIDPQTGVMTRWFLDRNTPHAPPRDLSVWRPVMCIVVTCMIGWAWKALWAAHLVAALFHLAVGGLAYRLLRVRGRSRASALAWSALLLAAPMGFEAWMWLSASTIALGSAGALLSLVVVPTYLALGGWWRLFACVAGAALALGCHEQPAGMAAGGLGAMVLVAWLRKGTSVPRSLRLRRGVLVLVLVGAVYALYAGLLVLEARATGGTVGGGVQLVDAAHWPREAKTLAKRTVSVVALMGYQGTAAWRVGLEVLRAQWVLALLAGCTLALGVWVSLRGLRAARADRRTGSAMPPPTGERGLGEGGGMLVALGVVLGGMAPLMIAHDTPVRPRMVYVLMVGLAMLGAGITDLLLRKAHRAVLAGMALAWLAAIVFFAASSVGMQRGFQARQQLDDRDAAQLREALATPPPPEHAVLAPVMADSLGVRTGYGPYDTYFVGPWYNGWSGYFWIQHTLQRRDVRMLPFAFHPTLPGGVTTYASNWQGPIPDDPAWIRSWGWVDWRDTPPDLDGVRIEREGVVRVRANAFVPVFVTDAGVEVLGAVRFRSARTGEVARVESAAPGARRNREVVVDVP